MFADLHNLLAQAGRCMSDKTNIVEFTAGIIPEPHDPGFTVWNLDVTRLPGIRQTDRAVRVLPPWVTHRLPDDGTANRIRAGVNSHYHLKGLHDQQHRDGCPLCEERWATT